MLAYIAVAHIGQVRNAGAFANGRVLDLNKISEVNAVSDVASRSDVDERSDIAVLAYPAFKRLNVIERGTLVNACVEKHRAGAYYAVLFNLCVAEKMAALKNDCALFD